MKRHFPILLLLLAAFPLFATAQTYKTESGHVEFRSEVPLHSFTGTSEYLVGLVNLADSTVDFYVDMTTVETGIGKRDKDMMRTLETDRFPFASFYGKLISEFDPQSTTPQKATVRGTFEIHGVERQVTIDGTLQITPEGLKVTASWTLRLEDYNIEPPGILFYRVDQKQDIEIEALLTPTDTKGSN